MDGFWLGWWTILGSMSAIALIFLLWARAELSAHLGVQLGFAFIGLVTYSLQHMSIKYLVIGFIAMMFIGFVRLALMHERAVYKWTNGRPNGEK